MTHGSLFSGIGGFDLGFERAGFRTIWQVEIEPFCLGVLKTRFPDAERFRDIRDCGADNLQPVDVITAGVPCQDVSVAGKRAGLAGERTGLFYEFARILRELRPAWFVFENVPGLLSSEDGRDFQIVLDSLSQIGYTCDVDILDSQEFGVAQRRRRVFITGARLDVLLQKRTPLSRQISADLIAQQLLDGWVAIQPASSVAQHPSDFGLQWVPSADSRKKRMRLLLAGLGQNPFLQLLDGLAGQPHQCGSESSVSKSPTAESKERLDRKENRTDTLTFPLRLNSGESGLQSIATLLSSVSEENFGLLKSSITSTSTTETTETEIFTYAGHALITIRLIIASVEWSESCWSVAQWCSILLREFIDYARQANRNLFVSDELRGGWRNHFDLASAIKSELERGFGIGSSSALLPESESGTGDSASGGAKGQDVAGSLTGGTGRVGSQGCDDGANIALAATLMSGSGKHGFRTEPGEHIVIQDVRGGTRDRTDQGQGIGIREGGPSYTLSKTEQHAVAFNWQSGGRCQLSLGDKPTALQANQTTAVACSPPNADGMRDLAGLPEGLDDSRFPLLPKGQDSARYSALGNAVTVSVACWIAGRIKECSARNSRE